jgi:hypothetical protein
MSKIGPDYDPSRPVIRMINQNRHRPVNLLGKHHSDEAMRPGHRPERQDKLSPITGRLPMAVRTADEEGEIAGAALGMTFQEIGEVGAAQRLAPFVEHDTATFSRKRRDQTPSFLGKPLVDGSEARFGEFPNLDAGDPAGASERSGMAEIVFDKRLLGPGLEPSDRQDMKPEAQTATRSSGACSDHSFSRL